MPASAIPLARQVLLALSVFTDRREILTIAMCSEDYDAQWP